MIISDLVGLELFICLMSLISYKVKKKIQLELNRALVHS